MERLAWHLVYEQLTTTNQLTPVAPAREYSTVLTYYKCKGEMENGARATITLTRNEFIPYLLSLHLNKREILCE